MADPVITGKRRRAALKSICLSLGADPATVKAIEASEEGLTTLLLERAAKRLDPDFKTIDERIAEGQQR